MLRPGLIDVLRDTLRHLDATTEISHDDPKFLDFQDHLARGIAELEHSKQSESSESAERHRELVS